MKNLNFRAGYALAVLLTSGLLGCKKTETTPEPQGQASCEMTIDNAVVAFSSTGANVYIGRLNGANAGIMLSASNDNGNQAIKFLVYKTYDNTGRFVLTHNFADSHAEIMQDKFDLSANNTYADYQANTANQFGDGYLEITKREPHYIEGTFALTAYNRAGKLATLRQGRFAGPIQ